jgi:hypothetical protein
MFRYGRVITSGVYASTAREIHEMNELQKLGGDLDITNAQAGVGLLVFDRLFVPLSPFLLKDLEHGSLGMLEHGRSYANRQIASDGIIARAELVHGVEVESVAWTDIAEARNGKDVARGEKVFATGDCSYSVVGGLGLDEAECAREVRGGGGKAPR